jgi:hypothetical protein
MTSSPGGEAERAIESRRASVPPTPMVFAPQNGELLVERLTSADGELHARARRHRGPYLVKMP